jgi:hypothetical protein
MNRTVPHTQVDATRDYVGRSTLWKDWGAMATGTEHPETKYANVGDTNVAYRVVGGEVKTVPSPGS